MTDTIFMIHGMWGGPWYWEKFRGVLEREGYRCVAPTLPYHDIDPRGTPDPRLGTASLLEYADALERQLAGLGKRPVLMGHSMGGLLAQILGARGLGRALVLLAPAAPAGIWAITPSLIRSFWNLQTSWGFWRKPLRPSLDDAVYALLHLLPEKERKQTHERLVCESGRAVFEIGYWPLDPAGASRVDETKITCPVLVVAGSEDRITPASVARRIARKYGALSTYKEFEHHAHWLVAEPGWRAIAEYVAGWLRSLRAAS
jgi:pimeloyl-ACP methyl ester carboxylesterase